MVHEELGDALRADKIAVSAKKMRKGRLEHGSSRHRVQTAILEGEVYCVVELRLRPSKGSV